MDTSNCRDQSKKEEDVSRKKEVKEEEAGNGNSTTDSVKSRS
jgi:hypothetical protein